MFSFLIALSVVGDCGVSSRSADDPRPVVGFYDYAVTGQAFEIYRDNVVLSYQADGAPYALTFSIAGTETSAKWSWTPSAAGSFPLTITARGGGWDRVASQTVRVSDGAIAATKVVLVGDSGTENAIYPCSVQTAVGANVTFLGTKTEVACTPDVKHEGWAGKTWCFFATDPTSPFRSGGAINISAYDTAVGAVADVVVWELGYNDLYTTALSAIDTQTATALACADSLISAWQAAHPSTIHLVQMVIPGNKDDLSYFSNYTPPTANTEWEWRRKNHRENELIRAHWPTDGAGGVYLVPAHLHVDRVNGYPGGLGGNALHNNQTGYDQIAAAMAAALKYHR